MTIDEAKIITLPKILDARGNLSYVEEYNHIPFQIRRTYWLYDVPGGISRGGHAEINNEELIIALSGSFEIMLDDGTKKKTYLLNRSYYGLYIPKGVWREIKEFSTNAVALEFGSIPYSKDDYIRDYDSFIAFSTTKHKNLMLDPLHVNIEEIYHKNNVFDCNIIELDKHHDNRKGNISVVENNLTLPFDVKRVYYLYDVPGGENRGAHAHKDLHQLIVAVSGSFTVTLDDGQNKRSFFLNRPYHGLYVKPGLWRDLLDFSSGAVAMVLASDIYKSEDYIREYSSFKDFRNTLV